MIKETLIALLDSTGYEAYLEGSIAPENFPDNFFTVWQFSSTNESYSNNEALTRWGFNVRFYSLSPATVEQVKDKVLRLLKEANFIPDGKGNDFVFSSEVQHTGWSVDVYFIEVN